jgi:hypothetical protein
MVYVVMELADFVTGVSAFIVSYDTLFRGMQ